MKYLHKEIGYPAAAALVFLSLITLTGKTPTPTTLFVMQIMTLAYIMVRFNAIQRR